MKKLLMLLSISIVVTSTTSSIVACGTKPNSNNSEVDQDLLRMLKNDANLRFDNHFIKNNTPFVDTFENSKKFSFFKKENLEALYTNPNDGEMTLPINSLQNLDNLRSDMQNFVNLKDLEDDINSLKKDEKNNYSVFLSNVNNVYVGYDFGQDFTIKKQTQSSNGKTTYSGDFEVNFKWQYYTQSINTDTYKYKANFVISDDEELIANISGIADVGKKLFNDATSLIHFKNSDLKIKDNESWKDVSQEISRHYKVIDNIDALLDEIKEYTNNTKFKITYDPKNLLDELTIANEFKYTNSNSYLSGKELETFNNLIFKADLTADNWKEFFNLNSNKESYINFENSVSEAKKIWKDPQLDSKNINEYLKGIYSFGQFKLNNLQISYQDGQPINLGPVIIPFTYKSSYTTISSNDIDNTSIKAKEYLTNLISEFHKQTKLVKPTDSKLPDNSLGMTSTTKNSLLWEGVNLNFGSNKYTQFYYNDYNETLKKIVINGENNILKFEGSKNSYVYKFDPNYIISDSTTTKNAWVNLGYFKYKFSHKGAIFYAKV
ncbi:hypothetical protein [Spiroplasma floricola]|uniref:Lipoprotein n=1 Tax=Spiroplasma floricola 23-6 TaxID=1336749 RepID=A0A2K8SE94_9MOLU|nr:hypothetical protein [Spiroplasma floricola]AUB31784.1 hypothetical protein SFLOR_v1c07360 [Spiroplasma floricola 23-6]